MNNFVSTVQQPIKFFEDLIIEGGYELYRDEFFAPWEKFENDEYGGMYVSTYKEDNYLVHDFEALFEESKNNEIFDMQHSINILPVRQGPKIPKLYDEFSTYDHCSDWKRIIHRMPGAKETRKRLNLKDVLYSRISKEFIISQQLISKAISEITFNNNSPDIFLNQQLLLSKRLSEMDIWLFKEYPNCKSHLESISQYIFGFTSKTSKEILEINSNQVGQNELLEDNDLIYEILGYLNGKNEHGIQIMTEQEYLRLINTIQQIFTNKEIPEVLTKFHIKVPVGVLRYTFYLLLPLFEDFKESFMQFIHDSIYEFEMGSYSYFKTKISVPPTTIPSYLPSIFREKKQQQMNKYK